MNKINLAVIGLGNMGNNHCKDIANIESAVLKGVWDVDQERVSLATALYQCKGYSTLDELLNEGSIDGIIIATPHYFHKDISIEAFKRGIHVLTEKPVGVHVKEINQMIKAYETAKENKTDLVFSAMFQQRTRGAALKIKDLLDSGELGKIIRATWIVTDWYRTQSYYNSVGWRGTWKGDGGGVLMNQCPHQLDLYQWFFGCPDRVTGFVSLGKYHDIEVEDEVTAYFEYDNGMVGHFITSTGEAPGSNRLEIVGDRGKLIWENDKLTFDRNQVSLLEHLQTAEKGTGKPECWVCEIPISHEGGQHRTIIENFCEAISGRAEVIAPACEGLGSIAINNAIILSSLEKKMVTIPLDEDAFEQKLESLIEGSIAKKKEI